VNFIVGMPVGDAAIAEHFAAGAEALVAAGSSG